MTTTPPTNSKVSFSNRTYDVLKFIALVLLPALASLYFALSGVLDLPKTTEVVGTITVIDTFLGTILGISTNSYKKNDGYTDGTFVIDTKNPEKDVYTLHVETPFDELSDKKTITLKVQNTE